MLESLLLSSTIAILGTLSSLFGGILGSIFKFKNKNIIAFLYEITAGMMTGIVCFEMIPESFEIANIFYSLIGIIIGVILIYFIDLIVMKFNTKSNNRQIMVIIVVLSMAIHNAIEGLAIGSSFSFSISLGVSVFIGMFLHDIPEGMVVGITSKLGGKKVKKIMIETGFVGACVGIGTFIGNYIGKIESKYIAFCLSVAAGAMLYLVACELIPQSKENSKNKKIYLAYILGIIIGALIAKI